MAASKDKPQEPEGSDVKTMTEDDVVAQADLANVQAELERELALRQMEEEAAAAAAESAAALRDEAPRTFRTASIGKGGKVTVK